MPRQRAVRPGNDWLAGGICQASRSASYRTPDPMTLGFQPLEVADRRRHHGLPASFFFAGSAFQCLVEPLGPLLVHRLEGLLGEDLDGIFSDRGNRTLSCLPASPTLGANRLAFAQVVATGARVAGRLTEDAARHRAADVGVLERLLVVLQGLA